MKQIKKGKNNMEFISGVPLVILEELASKQNFELKFVTFYEHDKPNDTIIIKTADIVEGLFEGSHYSIRLEFSAYDHKDCNYRKSGEMYIEEYIGKFLGSYVDRASNTEVSNICLEFKVL